MHIYIVRFPCIFWYRPEAKSISVIQCPLSTYLKTRFCRRNEKQNEKKNGKGICVGKVYKFFGEKSFWLPKIVLSFFFRTKKINVFLFSSKGRAFNNYHEENFGNKDRVLRMAGSVKTRLLIFSLSPREMREKKKYGRVNPNQFGLFFFLSRQHKSYNFPACILYCFINRLENYRPKKWRKIADFVTWPEKTTTRKWC